MSFEVRNTSIEDYGDIKEMVCPECNSSNMDIVSGSNCWHCNYRFTGPFNYYLKRVVARFHYHSQAGKVEETND